VLGKPLLSARQHRPDKMIPDPSRFRRLLAISMLIFPAFAMAELSLAKIAICC
jgi:hypothetical protein